MSSNFQMTPPKKYRLLHFYVRLQFRFAKMHHDDTLPVCTPLRVQLPSSMVALVPQSCWLELEILDM